MDVSSTGTTGSFDHAGIVSSRLAERQQSAASVMRQRPAIIGAGLKMYLGHRQALGWIAQVAELVARHPGCVEGTVELFVLPSFPVLTHAVQVLSPHGVRVGAQDLFWEDRGPYTGEVSGAELAELGCSYVEVGHMERRTLLAETDDIVSAKMAAAFRNGLTPILCIGESQPQETRDAAKAAVRQLDLALAHSRHAGVVGPALVAYEPAWAIGAAASADPSHISTVCSALRAEITADDSLGGSRILYGGSAGSGLLARLGGVVDGLFVGRASHDVVVLESILDEATEVSHGPVE